MMGTIHALAGAAVASVAAGKADRFKARGLGHAAVFIAGILSHFALDALKHGHSGFPAFDIAFAFMIAAATFIWLRPRWTYAAGTLGALFPDMVDMLPTAIEIIWSRTIRFTRIFHYPWLDGRFNTGLDLNLLSILTGAFCTVIIVGINVGRRRTRAISNPAKRGTDRRGAHP